MFLVTLYNHYDRPVVIDWHKKPKRRRQRCLAGNAIAVARRIAILIFALLAGKTSRKKRRK
jgi:hypothetical protein